MTKLQSRCVRCGPVSPHTEAGKMATIVYAMFGVPLMLLCLSSTGQRMAESLRIVYHHRSNSRNRGTFRTGVGGREGDAAMRCEERAVGGGCCQVCGGKVGEVLRSSRTGSAGGGETQGVGIRGVAVNTFDDADRQEQSICGMSLGRYMGGEYSRTGERRGCLKVSSDKGVGQDVDDRTLAHSGNSDAAKDGRTNNKSTVCFQEPRVFEVCDTGGNSGQEQVSSEFLSSSSSYQSVVERPSSSSLEASASTSNPPQNPTPLLPRFITATNCGGTQHVRSPLPPRLPKPDPPRRLSSLRASYRQQAHRRLPDIAERAADSSQTPDEAGEDDEAASVREEPLLEGVVSSSRTTTGRDLQQQERPRRLPLQTAPVSVVTAPLPVSVIHSAPLSGSSSADSGVCSASVPHIHHFNAAPRACQCQSAADHHRHQPTAQHQRVPIWLVITCLGAYLCAGAAVLSLWKDWRLLDGVFLCFVSLSTIGFGGAPPWDSQGDQLVPVLCCLYMVLGLALVGASFSLVQEEALSGCRRLARALNRPRPLCGADASRSEVTDDES